jgi:hypothetical protein
MGEVVELFAVIPTSPRSSKTESGYKSYHHFCVVDFSRPDYPPQFGPEYPPPRIYGGFLLVFGADFWADFCPVLTQKIRGKGGGKSAPT